VRAQIPRLVLAMVLLAPPSLAYTGGPIRAELVGLGDRRGQHSIRINDQYRICFVWHDGGADAVEITDYH
jgi:proteic killer suppression protein